MAPRSNLQKILEGTLTETIKLYPRDYVFYTGGIYHKKHRASLRANSLKTITEVGQPVPIGELLRRAAHYKGEFGYDPAMVRNGLLRHQEAAPCVFWLLQKEGDGSFSAARYIQFPDKAQPPIQKGQQVIDRNGKLVVPLRDGQTINPTFQESTTKRAKSDSKGTRNPSWTRDELILALELYLNSRPHLPPKGGAEVTALSDELRKLGLLFGRTVTKGYRNPNGVYMKLGNFLRVDPAYTNRGRKGLSRGNKLEEVVWMDFASDPNRLRAVAASIRSAINEGDVPILTDDDEDEIEEAPEGKILTGRHRRRERQLRLVKAKKARFKKQHGRLFCEACKSDFAEIYDSRREKIFECHHMRPVETLTVNSRTKLTDLVLLCANCHRVVHARRPWLTIDELRALLNQSPSPRR